ncbi:hypothetical protein COV17_02245 [Candidatus Woesearchaeota archaeon CG10_big_fil_rev_8_21_14_0_10_36_11]|nr:MAG: hypothetical protein COV17_02245 [Candidatus Woesearchaeota archaeon CG10_big_fil_rev_8_21_14_0_10_36_11]
MQKVTLKNGLTILYKKEKGNSVVIQVMIKVGSNNEKVSEEGISHFIEHILFEGTKKRPTNQLLSNEIEKIGGEFNAYTTNSRTCYYIKVLKKHFSKAVDVLSDILQNSLFANENIVKEKKIVLKEIDMVHDEPNYYQWVLFQKNIFTKHPAKNPTYGKKSVIKSLTRTKVVGYFTRHYVPKNMAISIVGDVPHWKNEIEIKFLMKKCNVFSMKQINEPRATCNTVQKEKKKNVNTYLILGFKTVPRNHKDSYVFDIIHSILGRGQSGKMFIEIRSKNSLAYEVGTQNVVDTGFGYFAVYATIDKKNVARVKDIILAEMQKLKMITPLELTEAKDYIEGNYLLGIEDNQKVADQLLFWNHVGDSALMDKFLTNIKKVSIQDIRRVVDVYCKYYTMTVLEGK